MRVTAAQARPHWLDPSAATTKVIAWLEAAEQRHPPEQMAVTIVRFATHGYFETLGLEDLVPPGHD